MTADHVFVHGLIPRSPAAIRVALGHRDEALFAAEYKASLEQAKTTYSLQEVDEVVERWWRYVNLLVGHDQSMQIAEQVLAGDDVPVVPVDLAALRG